MEFVWAGEAPAPRVNRILYRWSARIRTSPLALRVAWASSRLCLFLSITSSRCPNITFVLSLPWNARRRRFVCLLNKLQLINEALIFLWLNTDLYTRGISFLWHSGKPETPKFPQRAISCLYFMRNYRVFCLFCNSARWLFLYTFFSLLSSHRNSHITRSEMMMSFGRKLGISFHWHCRACSELHTTSLLARRFPWHIQRQQSTHSTDGKIYFIENVPITTHKENCCQSYFYGIEGDSKLVNKEFDCALEAKNSDHRKFGEL